MNDPRKNPENDAPVVVEHEEWTLETQTEGLDEDVKQASSEYEESTEE